MGGVRWGPRRSCGGCTRRLALPWTPWLWGVSIPGEAWPWGMCWRGLRGLRRVTLGHSLSPCNCCRRGLGHPLPMVEHSALQKGSSRGPVLPPSSHCSWALVMGSSVASVFRPQFLPLLQSAPSLPCASACSGAAFLEEVGHGPQAPQRQACTGMYRRIQPLSPPAGPAQVAQSQAAVEGRAGRCDPHLGLLQRQVPHPSHEWRARPQAGDGKAALLALPCPGPAGTDQAASLSSPSHFLQSGEVLIEF